MFGIGIAEILVVLVLVLVLINPKDLPKIARKLGSLYRKFRDVRDKVNQEVREVEREIRKPFEESANEIDTGIKETVDSVKISQPLPDPKSIMPSKNIASLIKEEPVDEPEENKEMET